MLASSEILSYIFGFISSFINKKLLEWIISKAPLIILFVFIMTVFNGPHQLYKISLVVIAIYLMMFSIEEIPQ